MSYMTKNAINKRVKEHYEKLESVENKEIFGVFLTGSQNYIDEKFLEASDVDTRGILLPTKRDLILARDVTKPELEIDDEKMDRHDVRKVFNLLRKASLNNFEFMYTDYFVVNEKYEKHFEKLIELRDEIVNMDEKRFLMSLMGMSKRYLNSNSKYRKRLANIIRLNKTAKAYMEGKDFQDCLKAMDEDLIYEIRVNDLYSKKEANKLAVEVYKETKEIANTYENELGKDIQVQELKSKLNEILVDLVSDSIS